MNSKKLLKHSLFLFLSLPMIVLGSPKIQVVTSIPDFAWLVREVGGEEVSVQSLLKGKEDPHYIDAVPSFILSASRADMLCFVGLELEVGWLPRVLEKSGNRRIQPGGSGHCDLSKAIEPIDALTESFDRSHGHLHAAGNPHYWLSANNMGLVAKLVAKHLSELRPARTPYFQKRAKRVEDELNQLAQEESRRFKNKNLNLIQYHAEFSYFLDELGIQRLPYDIEEKPGVPPSAGHLGLVGQRAQKDKARLAIASLSAPVSKLQSFERLSGIPILQSSTMTSTENFPEFYRELSRKLLASLQDRES